MALQRQVHTINGQKIKPEIMCARGGLTPFFFWTMSSFLEGPKAALVASKDFDNGHYKSVPQHGIRAFGRVYSAWAYGQTVISSSPRLTSVFFLKLFFFCYSGSGNISTFTMDGKSFFFGVYFRFVLT